MRTCGSRTNTGAAAASSTRLRPRHFTWVPRAPVSTWRAPLWCSQGDCGGWSVSVHARHRRRRLRPSVLRVDSIPSRGFLRRRLSPRAASRRVRRCEVRVRRCADVCPADAACRTWPQGDCLWFGVSNSHTTTPKIFLRVYNEDGSGQSLILQKPFRSARGSCARASLLDQTTRPKAIAMTLCLRRALVLTLRVARL